MVSHAISGLGYRATPSPATGSRVTRSTSRCSLVLAARFRARGLIFSTPPRGGWSAVRRSGACEAPVRRALTRHAGGGLTYRPIAPLTLGRCAQRRSIVAIFGNKSALSAPALQQAVPRLRAALPQIRAGPAVVASRGGGYKPRRPGRHSAAPPTGLSPETPLDEQRMRGYVAQSRFAVKQITHADSA